MLELLFWIVLVVLSILVLTGSVSGALLAWFVIGFFAFIVLAALVELARS